MDINSLPSLEVRSTSSNPCIILGTSASACLVSAWIIPVKLKSHADRLLREFHSLNEVSLEILEELEAQPPRRY